MHKKCIFLTNVSKHKGLHEKDYGNIKYLNKKNGPKIWYKIK